MNHPYRYPVGTKKGKVLILAHIRQGERQRDDVYQVRMLCCGTEARLTGHQLYERIRQRAGRDAYKHCNFCPDLKRGRAAQKVNGLAVVATGPRLPRVDPWQPGEVKGQVTLVEPRAPGGARWLVRFSCCGEQRELSRGRIQDIERDCGRGEDILCPGCATRAAAARRREAKALADRLRAMTPVIETRSRWEAAQAAIRAALTAGPVLPQWYVRAGEAWPRPASLARHQPGVWGMQ